MERCAWVTEFVYWQTLILPAPSLCRPLLQRLAIRKVCVHFTTSRPHNTSSNLIILADIVKMIDSQPDLAPLIRRVRGGYLKIQGTWMPYEVSELDLVHHSARVSNMSLT